MPTESAIGPAIPPSFFCSFVSYPNKVGPATTSATTGLFKVYIRHVLAVDPVHKQKAAERVSCPAAGLVDEKGISSSLSWATPHLLHSDVLSVRQKKNRDPIRLPLSLSAVVCVLALRSSCKSLSLKGRRRMEERQRKERSRKWIYAIGSASE